MARGAPDYASSRIPARSHWGVDVVVSLRYMATAVGPGFVQIISAPVPINKLWRITNILAWNNNGATTRITGSKIAGGIDYTAMQLQNAVQYETVYLKNEIWMEAGNTFVGHWAGIAVGDEVYLRIHGTEIDIEQ